MRIDTESATYKGGRISDESTHFALQSPRTRAANEQYENDNGGAGETAALKASETVLSDENRCFKAGVRSAGVKWHNLWKPLR